MTILEMNQRVMEKKLSYEYPHKPPNTLYTNFLQLQY